MQPQQAYNGGQQQQQQPYGNSNGNGQGYGSQERFGAPQQQQYNGPQHMDAPPTYQENFGKWAPDQKPTFDQAFKVEKPKLNDLWAGALFLAVVAGFVAVAGISIQGYAATSGFQGGGIYGSSNDFGLSTNTIVLFAFCLGMALLLGYGYVSLARMFTKQFIWITGILHVVFGFVTAIYMLVQKQYSGGIVFLLFACFAAFCFYTWIPRIPFSVLILQTVIDVSRKFGHVYLVSFLGGLLAAAFGAFFSVTLVAVYVKYEPGNNPNCSAGGCSSAKVIGLLVFITFAGYWITEWLKNTIHTTISGVYGAWYFAPTNPPKGATRGAAKRALTYSFGSISLGSLLVAIINMVRQACSIAQQNAGGGNMGTQCAFCILQCVLGLLDWAVQFINRYAFSYMALYGKGYIASAKATWKMIKGQSFRHTTFPMYAESSCRPRHRRPHQRVPHRTCPDHGRDFRGIRLRSARVPLPALHRPGIQPKRRVHTRRCGLRVPHRTASHQLLHRAVVKRHRHNLRGSRLGPRGPDARARRPLCAHGGGLPARAADDTCLRLWF